MTGPTIPLLVVDDDQSLRRLLRTGLAVHGFRVSEAPTGAAALQAIATDGPQVVLLDLRLPDIDGLDVLKRVRASGSRVPIVVLSSRGDERGKVEALTLGADDYVTKPFGMAELLARIRTALRHGLQERGSTGLFEHGDLRIDLLNRRVIVRGAEVRLSNKEWKILELLAVNAGRVLTHRAIMEQVWGPTADVQYLRIYVRQLRQKLEVNPEQPVHIITETGVGYRLRAAD